MNKMHKLRERLLNQYSINWLALVLIAGLSTCGEFSVTVPLLIATVVYSLQLTLVKWLFVHEMKESWSRLEKLNESQNKADVENQISHRFFSLACWAASILFLLFSLLILLSMTAYVGYKVSSSKILIVFTAFALMVAILAYKYNTESIPSIANLKREFLSPSLHKWSMVIDRLGVAATVLVLVMTLHALGSMMGYKENGSSFDNEDMKQILGYITYFHSFAVMSGIFYVYTTHQILSNVGNARMKQEFPMISLGLLMFYGAVQTILIVSVHLPVYAHLYTMSGKMEDVPIGEIVSALGPLLLSVAGSIVAKLSRN